MRWKRLLFLLILVALVVAGIWFLVVRMEREAPLLSTDAELEFIGKKPMKWDGMQNFLRR